MSMKNRSFTNEEKLKIIKEASENRVNETLEKSGKPGEQILKNFLSI